MTTQYTYDKCLEEMYALRRFGIKLELATMERILGSIANPQRQFKCVHVAGTNGKGSIAAILATILQHAGLRAGLYTSPHLVRFNERIKINGKPIDDSRVIEAYQAVKGHHGDGREPTFFELTTAMAFYVFYRENVDIAIIETGMGGRFDATNVITPVLSIISNISVEHRMYLGNTLAEIAREKAGIIKHGIPVITGTRQKPALEIIQEIATARNAPFYRLGEHARIRKRGESTFSYFGMDNRWKNLRTALAGEHQLENAAIAVAACELLARQGIPVEETAVREGLKTVQWPARLEIVAQSPTILIDGAHNLVAAKALATHLTDNYAGKSIILVIGILDDKPHKAILKALVPACDRVIVTRADTGRAFPPETLAEAVTELGKTPLIRPTVGDAIALALEQAQPDNMICIAGSLYVAGDAKAFLAA
ncbi:MAG: folylpolyglutamate synthase/dihydrofolate synthase family protein [Thermodesulfobacteriota bacterium]|nr:folylpolyglutamate synthase/dihydrofolate synthase family protein [Thermodesulfobacteriota bacterium]